MIEDGLARESEEAEGLPLEDRLGQAALAALMGDPYEVGLRIALDDGVAAALPTVARELAVLDRAVGVVRGGLAGLAPAAPKGVLGMLPGPVVGASGAEAAPETIRTGANPAPDLAVSRGQAPRAPMENVLRAAGRAAEMLPSFAAPDGPVPPASLPPARVDWQRTDWPALAAVPGVAAPEPPAPASFPLEAVAAPSLPELPSAAPEAVEAPGWAGAQRQSAAPPALPPSLLLPPDFAEPAMPERAEPEAAAEREEERVLEGRLEIDGALLGRFVAEHLAREAGRPASGMTGFDPLVSPQWAGALQG